MINNGYLFSNNKNRLFINTSLECSANCSYCYLPALNYSKGTKVITNKKAEEIIAYVKNYPEFIPGANGTLISFGCYSECWDDINKPETIKLIKYFLSLGNQIQLSTKKYINFQDLNEIKDLIKYETQLVILISSATISNWEKFENNTTPPFIRFKSFEIQSKLNIPMALYIKPVLPNITKQDINKYLAIIKQYNIKNVIVGSLIKNNGTGEIAPFTNNNKIRFYPIKEEDIIKEKLSSFCNVYSKSTEFLNNLK